MVRVLSFCTRSPPPPRLEFGELALRLPPLLLDAMCAFAPPPLGAMPSDVSCALVNGLPSGPHRTPLIIVIPLPRLRPPLPDPVPVAAPLPFTLPCRSQAQSIASP